MIDPLPNSLIATTDAAGRATAESFLVDIETSAADGDAEAGRFADAPKQHRPLMEAILAGSPFLRSLIQRDPGFAASALASEPGALLDQLCSALAEEIAAPVSESEAKALLRQARRKAALVIALADLSGRWTVQEVTAGLTRFADAALGAAVDWLLRDAHGRGQIVLSDPATPGTGSGLIVLAMGKYGAGELNYSSDIDIIIFYDPATAPLAEGIEAASFFVKLTKRLVQLLQDITAEGYVFRVDLRLRPDPRATSAAIAVEAAALYYEHMGQNWERAAMIKARPAAGDLAAGEDFLQRLVPFIWRKYLDFAAILDVQSMKRQIQAVKGHGTVAVRGHNIKLGRGGIREIEFFVQTQQLIAGGRNPSLRGRRTLEMLQALTTGGWIAAETAEDMTRAYLYLRAVEHRIQMVADEQSHTLPANSPAFEAFTRFSGYDDPSGFTADLERVLKTVERHYSALFEQAPGLGSGAGSLVFTGGEDDPETLKALQSLGFTKAPEIAATIRGWHFGRYQATRSARARERLTEIMPSLLEALGHSGDPDAAFIAFDRFIAGLPAGVQLFSLLWSNPKLLDLLADIMGTAPRLAALLSGRPRILDAVLDPGFFGPLPEAGELDSLVDAALASAVRYEEILDRARAVGQEQMFRIGVRVLADTVSVTEAGQAYAALADVLARRLLAASLDDFITRHGRVEGSRLALIAMGKWGGREMTASSDLDMILVYETEAALHPSDGPGPLPPAQYFTRLSQRLIAALSAPTAEGVLYDVDMRLRPSGNAGPVATHIDRFESYHQGDAWTWERMALTRARVVAGDEELQRRIETIIDRTLREPRDQTTLREDVVGMRQRLFAEFGKQGPWDLKHARGGIIDIEFIAQFLQLAHAREQPQILAQNTHDALSALQAAELLAPDDAHRLLAADRFFQRLTQLLRVCVAGKFVPDQAPAGLKRLLARAGDAPDFRALDAELPEVEAGVREIFERVVG
ncbi:glutamate-ammonia-ligase adenylyltransferase [Rhodoligotrophos appendicifer]|uniref:bifunctional [glutamine synthetase] adenylyltransferase/[glutamine synthetase]-adenylyl-L-tyrosine phosphorylase n=1 Tax=Rhodoligotrophos appendicifer TaxID=987056 RepID=UPI0011857FF9|nr:bifunctional [glutamine synthetase] adenylyltransferase/[glutamine synthetase]-adenylyl-L-tyrosine phosphorylase [Rhodoligotrophos appendicifer]